jgi:hypothetical protein
MACQKTEQMALLDFEKFDKKADESKGTVIDLPGLHYVCKTKKLDEVICRLPYRELIHWVTVGHWSMHELLLACLQFSGPAEVYISSYAFSEQPARLLADLKNNGTITKLHCLIDSRIDVRSAGALQLLKVTADTLKLVMTHAKVTVIENEKHSIAIVGSANYTTNERYEAGFVSMIPELTEFHKAWIVEEIMKTDIKNERRIKPGHTEVC